MALDNRERIPNNVGLGDNRALQRALEHWQPHFLDWWKEMGPAVFVMSEGKLYTATITMTVNFLAPAKPGKLIGEANVTQLGKTVAFVEGRLMAGDGTVLATAATSARLVETAKAIR